MSQHAPSRSHAPGWNPTWPAAPSRRDLLRGGMAALALGALQVRLPAPAGAQETASPTADLCLLTPEMTEGPYYLDTDLLREDVTEGTPGLPLRLQVLVADSQACTPLTNAAVDIWHCDAQGFYSGVNARPGGGAGESPAVDSGTFLRGIQLTGEDGVAAFTTIYPGWYTGRTVHIHMKVHIDGEAADTDTYDGGHVSHTGQLFSTTSSAMRCTARTRPTRAATTASAPATIRTTSWATTWTSRASSLASPRWTRTTPARATSASSPSASIPL